VSGRRSAPPTLRTPTDAHMPPIHRHTLENGLDVHIIELRDLPVVDVRLVVRTGAASDEPHLAGRAFLTAALLEEGTTTRDAFTIADTAELLGASLASRASWDHCSAALHVLEPRLADALELLADIVIRPAFPEREIERKRAERLAGIAQECAEPRTLASQTFARMLFGETHAFGLPIGGTPASIARITRADIVAFHRRRFCSRNAFLVLAGDIAARDVLPLLAELFGALPAGDPPIDPPLPPPATRPGIHIVDRPGAPQSEIRIGHPGPPRHTPDYFPLQLANTVLGGAFTSRLNMLLREEKAYTYGAGSSFAFRAEGGPFLATTAVFTDVTADAVQSIVSEVERMSAEPVTAGELERARNYITLGLPRTFETTADLAEHAGEMALYDLGTDYYDRYAALIRSVTTEDVQASAERWMRCGAVVIVGDAERIASDLERLGIGEVYVREGD
jgi:zinc protease